MQRFKAGLARGQIRQLSFLPESTDEALLCPQGFHSSSAGPIEDEQASHRLRTCKQNAQLGRAPTPLSHAPRKPDMDLHNADHCTGYVPARYCKYIKTSILLCA